MQKEWAFGKPRQVYLKTGIPAFDANREREFFVYPAPISNFLSGQERTVQVEVTGEADFELVKISCAWYVSLSMPSYLSAYLQGYWPIKVVNVTNSENLFSNFDFGSIQAGAKFPFVLPDPHPIAARSILDITVTNTIPADIGYFCISLIGAKVYQ